MRKRRHNIGVDFGTVHTLVYADELGVVWNEPTAVAFDRTSGKRIAAGSKASMMYGKTHNAIELIHPVEGGVISNLDASLSLLEHVFLQIESRKKMLKGSSMVICCPSDTTEVEKQAVTALAHQLGAADVRLEESVKVGALGSGADIFSPEGFMVVDIGGGTSDAGILSLGDLVSSRSVKTAGLHIDREIVKYIRYTHNLAIGPRTAEQIKIHLGTLRNPQKDEEYFTCAGRDLNTGLPKKLKVMQSEIRHLCAKAVRIIEKTAAEVLAAAPPEIASDVFRSSVVITGGGALIDGLQEHMEHALSLKVRTAPNPFTSVVDGSKILLESSESHPNRILRKSYRKNHT